QVLKAIVDIGDPAVWIFANPECSGLMIARAKPITVEVQGRRLGVPVPACVPGLAIEVLNVGGLAIRQLTHKVERCPLSFSPEGKIARTRLQMDVNLRRGEMPDCNGFGGAQAHVARRVCWPRREAW